MRAKRSSNQVLTFLNYINKMKCKGILNFEHEVKKYKQNITSKSMIVLISDFLFPLEQLKNTLYMFKHHELKVVQVLDKSETNFMIYGSVEMEDSETGQKLEAYI